jgi:hypothetical protein
LIIAAWTADAAAQAVPRMIISVENTDAHV